jgi:hypothetical protein
MVRNERSKGRRRMRKCVLTLALIVGCSSEKPSALPVSSPPQVTVRMPTIVMSDTSSRFSAANIQDTMKIEEPSLFVGKIECQDKESRELVILPMVLELAAPGRQGDMVAAQTALCRVADGEIEGDGEFALEATVHEVKRPGQYRLRLIAGDGRTLAESIVSAN